MKLTYSHATAIGHFLTLSTFEAVSVAYSTFKLCTLLYLLIVSILQYYRVTCIIVDNLEFENWYVVNFKKQTIRHLIAMINIIMWEKYYTDSCSMYSILNNVATPQNCTITQRQRTLHQDSA